MAAGMEAPSVLSLLGVGEDILTIFSFLDWPQRAAAPGLSSAGRCSLGFSLLYGDLASPHDGSGYWRFLCQCLAEEHDVYVPMPIGGGGGEAALQQTFGAPPSGVAATWRGLFLELFALQRKDTAKAAAAMRARRMVLPGAVPEKEEEEIAREEVECFKIGVAARFRPAQSAAPLAEEDGVILPLHQKVQLVRQQLGCSQKEALSLIMRRRRRHNTEDFDEDAGQENMPDNIFQPCVCPKSKLEGERLARQESTDTEQSTVASVAEAAGTDERTTDARCSIMAVQEDKASVLAVTKQSGLREFCFDRVFAERSGQKDIYELTARRLVMDFLNGTSASIICYGQTGSGKTHTMFGAASFGPADSSTPWAVDRESLQGLVPRTCGEVLGAVERWQETGLEVRLAASYVELFGSEVSDLLREGRIVGQGQEGRYEAVRATDRVGHRYVLDGHTEVPVRSIAEVDEVLLQGDSAKRRAATAMNERSTRAHTVFVLALTVQRRPVFDRALGDYIALPPRTSRFYFADLGGSEQLSKSKVDADTKAPVIVVGGEEQSRISWQEFYQHRRRIQETLNINKGLFSLKRVIEALHRRSRMAAEGVPPHALPYVPYQDSKLTMLLQEALGGASRTLIVTTATMDPAHAEESLQTLRFGETCAQVQKRREADQAESIHAALEKIDKEMQVLQAEIARKERWETRRIQRQDVDTVGGAFGETQQTYVRDEVMVTSVLVGAEKEREQLEQLLLRQAELKGLTSFADMAKDYRHIHSQSTADKGDGGRGIDFREQNRFSARTKAKDFEDEFVVADALRAYFRKAKGAVVFGESAQTIRRKVNRNTMFEGYMVAAAALRRLWEDQAAAGLEERNFGKTMLDRCTKWRSASVQTDPVSREAALAELLKELGLDEAAAIAVNASSDPSHGLDSIDEVPGAPGDDDDEF